MSHAHVGVVKSLKNAVVISRYELTQQPFLSPG